MIELIITITFYAAFFIISKAIRTAKKSSSNISFFEEVKTLISQEFSSEQESFVEETLVEEVSNEEDLSVFSESYQALDTSDFETELFTQEDELYDEVILEVDRSLTEKNIKDVRSLINKRSLRKNIIIKEILDKPKSLN